MEKLIKKYNNGEVTVVWQPDLCIHSKICWDKATGLPEVFNPQLRPWIDVYAADTEEIIAQVKKCPSSALSYLMNREPGIRPSVDADTADAGASDVVVHVMKNGPLIVYGNITVKDADGAEIKKTNTTAFCRCGASKKHPYCDGTHHEINFEG